MLQSVSRHYPSYLAACDPAYPVKIEQDEQDRKRQDRQDKMLSSITLHFKNHKAESLISVMVKILVKSRFLLPANLKGDPDRRSHNNRC